MLERKLAALRAHRNNIRRYRRLLGTNLTDIERAFISKRIEEEEQALQSLSENDAHLLPATRIAPPQQCTGKARHKAFADQDGLTFEVPASRTGGRRQTSR